ncbi:hypothetical protein ACWFRB_09250 [Rhodococcus sp. NPDC055112]
MAIPAYGSLVPLIGRINTSVLAIGQVRWFTWSAYFQQLVEHGYADIYDPMEPGVVVALKVDGTAATYASLPTTGLTPGMVYVVQENGRAYVWNGTAWPAQASGISITGPTGPGGVGIANITVSGTNLVFDMTAGPDITRAVPALEDAQAWRDQVEQFVQFLQTTVAPEVEGDRAAAEGAAAAAVTAQGVSEGARDAALGAQGTATTEANRARDEADDAAESATLAGGHADAAGQSAGAAATAKGQVDTTKAQIDTIKGEIDTARVDTVAAKDVAVTARGETLEFRDQAEQIVADAAAGVVPDGGVTTPKIVDGAVTGPKLASAVQSSLAKAESASQPGHTHPQADVTGLVATLGNKEDKNAKGAANGYAPLDANGFVPPANLPSYVDDVLEYANLGALPGTGVTGKIFVVLDTGKIYRWSGSAYVEISPSPGSTDSVTEGATNKYYTDARAQAANAAAIGGRAANASGQTNMVWVGTQAAFDALSSGVKNALGFIGHIY